MVHLSEGLTHDLTNWRVAIGGRWFTFVDRRSASPDAIDAKAGAAFAI